MKEGQTIQWPKDTKGVIRSLRSKKETIQWPKYTKGLIRSLRSEKDRQYNGQKIPKG